MREFLRLAFEDKTWTGRRDKQPRSGHGSTLASTARLRKALPSVFERYSVKRFVDAPCGDWFWMQHVDLEGIEYIGGDIAKSIVEKNQTEFSRKNISFIHLDVTSDPLPECDLMMCRDCLFHLKFWLRWAFFRNFVQADIPYLMTTINHTQVNRKNMQNSNWRPFDPRLEPFNFPAPIEMIHETADELPEDVNPVIENRPKDKSMGIWSRAQIVEVLEQQEAKAEATEKVENL